MRAYFPDQSFAIWRRGSQHLLAFLAGLILSTQAPELNAVDFRGREFVGFTNFVDFAREQRGAEAILTSQKIPSAIPWNELIVSWNAELQPENFLKLEARGVFPDRVTQFYMLALWSGAGSKHPRESVKNQKDADGDVLTDTLALNRPGADVELRVTLGTSGSVPLPRLKFIGLSFSDTQAKPGLLPPDQSAWGASITVPERSQMVYPGGEVWCSPTSVSMVLAHWSRRLERPELLREVPDVAQAVFDRNWPGTGNWPFNTAFAGSIPGVRAYVTRLSDISELEAWIGKGVPVVVSVSYGELKGTGKRAGDGHLVVCAGFTGDGDPIVNDPGTRENVRRIFSRENLAKAWESSHHTVYLIYPENLPPPQDRFHHWFTR